MHTSREILENIISNYLGAEIMDDFFSSYLSFLPAPPTIFFHNEHSKAVWAGELNLISPLASDQNDNAMPVCGADTENALHEHRWH